MEYRHGGLYVVEQAHPRDEVQRELKKLDDRLFLERQLTFDNEVVWCVVCHVGSEIPPVTILEWRDEDGRPIPELSSGIVGRVARMDRDGRRLAARAIQANRDRIERASREARERYEQVVEENIDSFLGRRSALLHRGQHLRRARDKKRAKGWNV